MSTRPYKCSKLIKIVLYIKPLVILISKSSIFWKKSPTLSFLSQCQMVCRGFHMNTLYISCDVKTSRIHFHFPWDFAWGSYIATVSFLPHPPTPPPLPFFAFDIDALMHSLSTLGKRCKYEKQETKQPQYSIQTLSRSM